MMLYIRRIRISLVGLGLALWLLAGGAEQAWAQYKHNGLGASTGMHLTFNQGGNQSAAPNSRANAGYGIGISYFTLSLEYNHRFMDALAFNVEGHFSVHSCGAPNDICVAGSTPLMISGVTGLRWYILTDDFRPYLDVGMAYWQTVAFVQNGISAFGPALGAGFDWYFMEELSLGVRFRYGLQLFIGPTSLVPFHQIQGLLNFTAYI